MGGVWAASRFDTAGPLVAGGMPVVRILTYVALAATLGGAITAAVVGRGDGDLTQRARRVALVGAAMLVPTVAVFGAFGTANATGRQLLQLDGRILGAIAGTGFGRGVLVFGAGAVVTLVLAAASRTHVGDLLVLTAAGAAAIGLGIAGHANAATPRWAAATAASVHVLGAAIWVGGLVVVWLVVLAGRTEWGSVGMAARRFSTMAGVCLVAVLVSGLVTTWLHVDALAQLWTTDWGRFAMAKSVVFAGIAVVGWFARTRWLPVLRSTTERSRKGFVTTLRFEAVLMLIAFSLAGLMASGQPAAVEAAARVVVAVADFGDDSIIDVSIDPNRDELHVYVFSRGTQSLRLVEQLSATVVDDDGQPLEGQFFPSGPGHLTGVNVQVPSRGGVTVRVTGTVAGEERSGEVRLVPR